MKTLYPFLLIPLVGFIVALYLDSPKQREKRLIKEKKEFEKILGKDFDLESLIEYHIKSHGKDRTREMYKRLIVFMERIGNDISKSEILYSKYFS